MTNELAVFQDRIRKVWHEGEWWFSVVDVVGVLTDSANPRRYWTDMKRLISDQGFVEVSEKCRLLKLRAPDGKMRETDCGSFATMMSLISYVPAWGRTGTAVEEDDTCPTSEDSGVYAISNMATSEQYIGSSQNMSVRFRQHLQLLQRGDHHAAKLQKAWNQYGKSSFRFEVLERGADPSQLQATEQTYLDDLSPAYNGACAANNHSGIAQVSVDRYNAVLALLYDGQPFCHSPFLVAIRDAMVAGALRPGPNFHLLLNLDKGH